MPLTSTMRAVSAARSSGWRRLVLLLLAALWILSGWWQTHKPLPVGLHLDSGWLPLDARDVTFIADITAADAYGRPVTSQAIFEETLAAIRGARRFIVLDYHLFNGVRRSVQASPSPLPLAAGLRAALLAQLRELPQLQVLLIVDPVNLGYARQLPHELELLRAAGVSVVPVDLERLRDSNFIYSSLWRPFARWWPRPPVAGSAGSSWGGLRGEPLPVESFAGWLRLLNVKSDDRKVLLADDGGEGLLGIVGSADPYDESSADSNTALRIHSRSLLPLLRSELAVARLSGWTGQLPSAASVDSATTEGEGVAPPDAGQLRVLTEGAVRTELLAQLQAAGRGESIDIAMAYLADRNIIEELVAAARRHASVRLILDPNRESFGHPRTGLPNQPAASELVAASDGAIHVRWYRTHGEQFQSRLALIYGSHRLWGTTGSATLTRRSLGDYNLEANVALELDVRCAVARQLVSYFDTLWSNHAALGIEYTADFGYFADPSQLHYWLYRLLEATGLGAF